MNSTEQYAQDSSTPTPSPSPWHVAVERMVADRIAEALDLDIVETIEEKLREAIDPEAIAENLDPDTLADSMFSGWEGDRRFRRLASMVAEDVTAEEIAEALGFDADDIAQALDCQEIAGNLDHSIVAACLDLTNVAESLDWDYDDIAERVARSLDPREVARYVDLDDLAGQFSPDDIAERIDLDEIAERVSSDQLAQRLGDIDTVRDEVDGLAEAHVAERDALRAEVEALREQVEVIDGALRYIVQSLAAFAVPFAESIAAADALRAAFEQTTGEAETTTDTETGGLYL